MTSPPKKVFVVSHVHWDREWYKTFHEFRTDLSRLVQKVLERLENDDEFHHFLLDGQAIVLEDYLEIHPEDEERIRHFVETRALSVGPWYILPDEFLVSSEATVRNLLIGHRVAGLLGSVQKVGYMPDSFGHIAQMPQILTQAGIDSFVYSRGNGDEIDRTGHEFFWKAPDGSRVVAINQCGCYDNAAGLGLASYWEAHTQREIDIGMAVEKVRELFAKMNRLSQGDIYLLNNGGDHIPPQRELGSILRALRDAFPETEFVHSGLEEYVDAVKAAGYVKNEHTGEMVQGRFHFILSGVWSARMYLKQLNDEAQTALATFVEPFSAYSHFVLGSPYSFGAIDYAWKLLLKNHPHDSICGCSTDEVHREMVPRFEGVIQTGEQLMRNQLTQIVPTFAKHAGDDGDTVIAVGNPLPFKRTEVVERLVVLQNFGTNVDSLELFDEAGRRVPFVIADTKYVRRFWGIDYRTELFADRQREMLATYLLEFGDEYLVKDPETNDHDCFVTIQFLAEDLPATSHTRYFLRDGSDQASGGVLPDRSDVNDHSVSVGQDIIENEFLSVRVFPNGTLDIHDKRSNIDYPGLNRLEDTEDIGDEYDYSPCAETETTWADDATGVVRVVEDTGLLGQLEAHFGLHLPEKIRPGRKSRASNRVECQAKTKVTVKQGSPIVEVELSFDNQARDHRLRTEFVTPFKTDTVISDGHFYLNRRSIDLPDGQNWMQKPPGTVPQQEFSALQDGRRGLAVLNRGLPEVQPIRDSDGKTRLSLTLLRSVGWLSRDDFDTRSCSNAGPTIATPDAQCIGMQRFQYAIVPYSGDLIDAGILGLSTRYRGPVMTIQGVADQSQKGGSSLVSQSSPYVRVSAIKRHEVRDSLLIRLCNLSDEDVEEELTFGLKVSGVWRTDLLENRVEELAKNGDSDVKFLLGPHEIVTLEVTLVK